MSNTQSLIVSKTDYLKLMALLEHQDSLAAEALEDELGRADIVADDALPTDVVSMGSQVRFMDLDNKTETQVVLVYPAESDVSQNRISILSPMGSALIGLPVGGTIDWPLPNGKTRRVKVISVTQAGHQ